MDQREIDAIAASLKRLKNDLKKVPLFAESSKGADKAAPSKPSKGQKPPAHK